jgi:hypothetical protein
MEALEILRPINFVSSLVACLVTGYLLFRMYGRFKESTGTQRRITGAALLGIAGLFFINSILLLTTFSIVLFAYDPLLVNLVSNVRVFFVNIITVLIAGFILLIESGRI